jgi:hypothetical protein
MGHELDLDMLGVPSCACSEKHERKWDSQGYSFKTNVWNLRANILESILARYSLVLVCVVLRVEQRGV